MFRNFENPNARRERKRRKIRRRVIGFTLFLCCCLSVALLTEKAVAVIEPNDQPASESPADWSLVLVNQWEPLEGELAIDFAELSNGELVDIRIFAELQDMLDDARDEGMNAEVVSGYRSDEEQQRIMDDKIAQYQSEGYSDEQAAAEAELWVAAPRTSEHHLGLAVDINADGIHSAGEDVYGWLRENAHKYGFILRYPPGKTDITGILYEPWHYRYVGTQAATEIYHRGICLEEYLREVSQ
jgi:D-alanyl-D-alanine carboxypeptidase